MRKVYATIVSQCRDGSAVQCKVYYNKDNAEYITRLYINGKVRAAADYFTNSKVDAVGTAEAMRATQVANRWV